MVLEKDLTITAPLAFAEDGQVLRVVGTRVPLDTIVEAYHAGASAKEIVSAYPSLQLPDVYAVLAYYLQNESELNDYLAERRLIAAQLREEHEQHAPSTGLRAALRARQRYAQSA